MTSTTARARLPPPAIFTHDETLHAILLPPLALFLSDLSTPEHLIKLHDILDRFRTPKSYHRIDVRLVESSELPPDGSAAGDADNEPETSPASGAEAVGEGDAGEVGEQQNGVSHAVTKDQPVSRKRKRDSGDPVILPEGMSMEEYLLARTASQEGTSGDEPATQLTPARADGILPQEPGGLESDTYTLASVAEGFTPAIPAETPIPQHELPPAPPTRRVRELRLDLRTLDAAALFHLETWRREVLGLQGLDLEHPDSIWYKDPSPPPSSPVEPPPPKRRPGRPPRRRSDTRDTADGQLQTELPLGGKVEQEECGQLVEALKTHGQASNTALSDGDGAEGDMKPLPDTTILDALAELEGGGYVDALPPATPGPVEEEGEPELDSIATPSRSPSPDVILGDLFDRREENDPDFIPPPPKQNRAKRTKEPLATDDLLDSSAFGDLDDVVDSTIAYAAGWDDPGTKPMKFINLTPQHLIPGTPSALSPESAIEGGERKRKRRYIFDGVVIETPRRRRSSLRIVAGDGESSRKGKNVMDLSSPDKEQKSIRGPRKSVRFEITQDEEGGLYALASGSRADDGEVFAVDDGVDIQMTEEVDDREGMAPMPDEPAKSVTTGDDEWDFLREL